MVLLQIDLNLIREIEVSENLKNLLPEPLNRVVLDLNRHIQCNGQVGSRFQLRYQSPTQPVPDLGWDFALECDCRLLASRSGWLLFGRWKQRPFDFSRRLRRFGRYWADNYLRLSALMAAKNGGRKL